MFSKLAFSIAIAMGVVVSADVCSTGPVQCCNAVGSASPLTVALISGLLGGAAVPLGTNVGVTCTPITVIGVGTGSTCQGQTVCCTNNSFNGVIAVGCSPVNLTL